MDVQTEEQVELIEEVGKTIKAEMYGHIVKADVVNENSEDGMFGGRVNKLVIAANDRRDAGHKNPAVFIYQNDHVSLNAAQSGLVSSILSRLESYRVSNPVEDGDDN